MSRVENFQIAVNGFVGTLPARGIYVVRAFEAHGNRLKGTLPDSGLRTMSRVQHFQISMNGFQGALPESGLHAMSALRDLKASSNCFSGALPDKAKSRSLVR
eukprot:6464825-Amphidinium_carterae.1